MVAGWTVFVIVRIAAAPDAAAVALGATVVVILVALAGILTFTWRVRICVTGEAITWRLPVRSQRWKRAGVARFIHVKMTYTNHSAWTCLLHCGRGGLAVSLSQGITLEDCRALKCLCPVGVQGPIRCSGGGASSSL